MRAARRCRKARPFASTSFARSSPIHGITRQG
jgi:hypothetical protein